MHMLERNVLAGLASLHLCLCQSRAMPFDVYWSSIPLSQNGRRRSIWKVFGACAQIIRVFCTITDDKFLECLEVMEA